MTEIISNQFQPQALGHSIVQSYEDTKNDTAHSKNGNQLLVLLLETSSRRSISKKVNQGHA